MPTRDPHPRDLPRLVRELTGEVRELRAELDELRADVPTVDELLDVVDVPEPPARNGSTDEWRAFHRLVFGVDAPDDATRADIIAAWDEHTGGDA